MNSIVAPVAGQDTRRNHALDLLRCVLAIAVVAIHANPLIGLGATANDLLTNGICRIAVPMFFIINGYYIAATHRDAPTFLAWARRLLALYVFWMVVYAPFYLGPAGHSLVQTLKTLVIGYLQLWYVISLLVAGTLLYLTRKLDDSALFQLASVLFLAGVGLQYWSFYSRLPEHFGIYRNGLFFAYPLLTLGYLMRKGFFEGLLRWRTPLLLLGLVAFTGELVAAHAADRPGVGFDIYASLFLICPLIFDVVRRSSAPIQAPYAAKLSSVIYFAHPLGIYLVRRVLHVQYGFAIFAGALVFCAAIHAPLVAASRRWKFLL